MIKVDLPKGLPHFKLDKNKMKNMLNDMADAGIVQIRDDVKNSKDINNKKLKALKPSTIKQKRKKGYGRKPLIASGKMIGLLRTKTASSVSLEAHINTHPDMLDVADFHNKGAGHLPKRLWFGVGKKLIKRMQVLVDGQVHKLIRTLWKKQRVSN
tara:strand:+ start:4699 stop:5163 length:465 start_codon:yes stop_codon:yes gene_type:complete